MKRYWIAKGEYKGRGTWDRHPYYSTVLDETDWQMLIEDGLKDVTKFTPVVDFESMVVLTDRLLEAEELIKRFATKSRSITAQAYLDKWGVSYETVEASEAQGTIQGSVQPDTKESGASV